MSGALQPAQQHNRNQASGVQAGGRAIKADVSRHRPARRQPIKGVEVGALVQIAALDDALPTAMRGGKAADSKSLAPQVCNAVTAGDVVLVKGSLGSRMALIVDALCALEMNDGLEANHAV